MAPRIMPARGTCETNRRERVGHDLNVARFEFASGATPESTSANDTTLMGASLAALHSNLARLTSFDLPPVAALRTVPSAVVDELGTPQLLHGDFRADNLFFDADGTVVVIDWQAISQGGGAADVGYFVSQNMSTEDRRAHE